MLAQALLSVPTRKFKLHSGEARMRRLGNWMFLIAGLGLIGCDDPSSQTAAQLQERLSKELSAEFTSDAPADDACVIEQLRSFANEYLGLHGAERAKMKGAL